MTSTWKDRGGYDGFNSHLREVAQRFSHIQVHPEIWLKTRPPTSASAHLFMKSVQRSLDGVAEEDRHSSALKFGEVLSALRTAFFRDCRDICRRDIQCQIAGRSALISRRLRGASTVEGICRPGFRLSRRRQDADRRKPKFCLKPGAREASSQRWVPPDPSKHSGTLRSPNPTEASWC